MKNAILAVLTLLAAHSAWAGPTDGVAGAPIYNRDAYQNGGRFNVSSGTLRSLTVTSTGATPSVIISSGLQVLAGGVSAPYFTGSGAALTGVVASSVAAAGVLPGTFQNGLYTFVSTLNIPGGSLAASGLASLAAASVSGGLTAPVLTSLGISTAGAAAQFVTVGASTASLQSQLVTVGAATATLAGQLVTVGASTAAHQSELNAVASSTAATQATLNALALSTAATQGTLNTLATSTAATQATLNAVAASTAAAQTTLNAVAVATAGLQAQFITVGASTASLRAGLNDVATSTNALQAQFVTVGASTAAHQSELNAVAAATATIQNQFVTVGASTASLQTQITAIGGSSGWTRSASGIVSLATATDNVTVQTTMTVQGAKFSVGVTTLVVTNGMVGIGTSAPTAELHLVATSGSSSHIRLDGVGGLYVPTIFMKHAGNTGTTLTDVSPGLAIASEGESASFQLITGAVPTFTQPIGGRPLVFSVAGAERMRFLSNGNLGIGTSNPATLVEIGPGDLQVGDATASTFSAAGFLTLAQSTAAPAAQKGRLYYSTTLGQFLGSLDGSTFVALSTSASGGAVNPWTISGGNPANIVASSPVVVNSSMTVFGVLQASTINAVGTAYQVNGVTVIDGSRNISGVNITATGNIAGPFVTAVNASTAATATNLAALGTSTGSLQAQLVTVGASTAAHQSELNSVASATATIQGQFVTVGASTAALQGELNSVATATTSIQTQFVTVGASTASLQTQLNAISTSATATVYFTSNTTNSGSITTSSSWITIAGSSKVVTTDGTTALEIFGNVNIYDSSINLGGECFVCDAMIDNVNLGSVSFGLGTGLIEASATWGSCAVVGITGVLSAGTHTVAMAVSAGNCAAITAVVDDFSQPAFTLVHIVKRN